MTVAARKQEMMHIPTLESLAREEMDRADGDYEKACIALCARLRRDAPLLKSIVAHIMERLVKSAFRHLDRQERERIVRSANMSSAERMAVLAGGMTAALLDFPLRKGIKLRDATREQVMDQAEFYGSAGADMLHKHRWLTTLAQALPADKCVGEVITEDRAVELWQETKDA